MNLRKVNPWRKFVAKVNGNSMNDQKERFIARIQKSTNQSLDDITKLVEESKLIKHSDVRTFLSEQLHLTYGDANTLAHYVLKSDGESMAEGKSLDEVIDEIYQDKKSGLKPIHTVIMDQIHTFGNFDIIPKKGYISLKRKRQFAMIGPKSSTRIELGINLKLEINQERFKVQPQGSMCQYIVNLTSLEDVDEELLNILRLAFEHAE